MANTTAAFLFAFACLAILPACWLFTAVSGLHRKAGSILTWSSTAGNSTDTTCLIAPGIAHVLFESVALIVHTRCSTCFRLCGNPQHPFFRFVLSCLQASQGLSVDTSEVHDRKFYLNGILDFSTFMSLFSLIHCCHSDTLPVLGPSMTSLNRKLTGISR